jgi:peroxiredoxin Q/BCP
MNALKIGDPAPDFKATATGGIYGGGQEVKLSDFKGSAIVLYFYPKDASPGCTIQACDLRDAWGELQSKVELFGVNVGSVDSHQRFIKKHGLPFPLISDIDRQLVNAYGVWGEQRMFGKTYMGTQRTTFAIGPDQKIFGILRKVKPVDHVLQLLKLLSK